MNGEEVQPNTPGGALPAPSVPSQRLRRAGLLGSMGSIGDCFDNALAESFFSSLQVELLDRQSWATRQQLANAIFEWIEAWYNPRRRHSALDYLSPIDYERAHTPAAAAA